MENLELWEEIKKTKRVLEGALSQLQERGFALNEAERKYKVAKAKRILVLKSEGYPATLLSDIVMGEEEVSQLRLERDNSEVVYKSCLEGINGYKVTIRILDNKYSREWGQAKQGG